MVSVALFDPTNPDAGYVLEGLKRGSSRVYGSYEEAKRDADRRNAAIARYEKLGDTTINYYDIYGVFIQNYELPTGTPPNESGGTPSGKGFYKIMFDNGWDADYDISLSELKSNMDPDIMAFLRSAAIQYPDAKVRSAIAQYFFLRS